MKPFCRFWWDHRGNNPTNSSAPAFSPPPLSSASAVTEYHSLFIRGWDGWSDREGKLQPYLLGCQIPEDSPPSMPVAVSLVSGKEDPCATIPDNCLRVLHNPPPDGGKERGHLAICVQALDFPFKVTDEYLFWGVYFSCLSFLLAGRERSSD